MEERKQKQLIRRPDMADCIAQILRPEILAKGKPGDRFHTVRDLCERFEATTHTIRAALKILQHERLIDVWPGSGAFVREPTIRDQHVALVMGIHRDHSRTGYYFFRLMEYLHQFFSERGLTPRLYWARQTPEPGEEDGVRREFTRAVAGGEVAGIVVLKGPLDARWWAAIGQSGLPVVESDRQGARHAVQIDYTGFLNEAVRHLALAGRRRIGLLAWSPDPPTQPASGALDFTGAFLAAGREYGCETRADWVRGDLWPVNAGAGYAMFREVWMAHAEKPDALVISDEALFADIATAILEIGIRVPEQLLIVTHANRGSGTLYPFPTARLEYDPDEASSLLGNQLLRLMRKEAVPEGVTNLPFRWVGAEVVQQQPANRPDESQEMRSSNP